MNRKSQTMQGWIEGIGIAVAFVLIFGFILVEMNDLYSENYKIEGLDTDTFYNALVSQQDSLTEKTTGGEIDMSGVTMTLSTSWDIIVGTLTMLWSFISAGWIHTIMVDYLNLGTMGNTLAYIFRGLFFLSIGFAMLKILFKRSI